MDTWNKKNCIIDALSFIKHLLYFQTEINSAACVLFKLIKLKLTQVRSSHQLHRYPKSSCTGIFSACNHYWEGLRCSQFLEWILVICFCPVCLPASFLPFDASYQMITSAGMFELRGGGERQGGSGASVLKSTFSSHASASCNVTFWHSLLAW